MAGPTTLRIGRRWRIGTPGHGKGRGGDELDLTIPRGAFGSGEHETTASCLEEIERLEPLRGARVLDVGCGTGILALAALRIGAESAVGVDISARAVVTTRRAAQLNGFLDRIVVILGPLEAVRPAVYDLVCANLHGDVLLDLSRSLMTTAAPEATLVLSGIAWEYAYPVREQYMRLGCRVDHERWLDEFVTLRLTAPSV